MNLQACRISTIRSWSLCCIVMAGCRNHPIVPALPPAMQTPGAFSPAPPRPASPLMQSALPDALLNVKSVEVSEIRPRHRIRRVVAGSVSVPIVETPQLDETTTAPTPNEALGALSPGGDSTADQSQAADRIAGIEQRLHALSGDTQNRRLHQVSQVKQFLRQASQALRMGDVQGAQNLAVKAGLLLDDLSK